MTVSELRDVPELRIDRESVIEDDHVVVIELEGAVELTRYHCLFVRRADGQWWVCCENLQLVLPLLPKLIDWHVGYIDSYLRTNRTVINDRCAVAMVLLMQYAHELVA